MSFIIIEQSKKDCINLALLLVFIDSIYFWGNSLGKMAPLSGVIGVTYNVNAIKNWTLTAHFKLL